MFHRVACSILASVGLIGLSLQAIPASARSVGPDYQAVELQAPPQSPGNFVYQGGFASGINDHREIVGVVVENFSPGPLLAPGTLWQDDQFSKTFGSGMTATFGFRPINNVGDVAMLSGFGPPVAASPIAEVVVVSGSGTGRTLAPLSTDTFAFPEAINEGGQVVGISSPTECLPFPDPHPPCSANSHGVLWASNATSPMSLGNLTVATSINNAGEVVGSDAQSGVLWDHGRITRRFEFVPVAINGLDQVLGPAGRLWEHGHTVRLPPLHSTQQVTTMAINNLGQVVGTSGGHAVLWDHRRPIDLGTLPGGTSSSATAIVRARSQGAGIRTGWCAGQGDPQPLLPLARKQA